MKHLLIILLALLPFISKSQNIPVLDSLGNVIYYLEDTTHIPVSVSKQIVAELIEYDGVKQELKLTSEQLSLTEQKVVIKDSIISTYVKKGIMYEDRITNEQNKFKIQGLWVEDLRKQNKKLKANLMFTKIVFSLALGGLMYMSVK